MKEEINIDDVALEIAPTLLDCDAKNWGAVIGLCKEETLRESFQKVLRTGDDKERAFAENLMTVSEELTPIVSEIKSDELLEILDRIQDSETKGLSLREEISTDPMGIKRAVRLVETLKYHLERNSLTRNEVFLIKKMAQGELENGKIREMLSSENESLILGISEKIKKALDCGIDINQLFSNNDLPTDNTLEITPENIAAYMDEDTFIKFQKIKEVERGTAYQIWGRENLIANGTVNTPKETIQVICTLWRSFLQDGYKKENLELSLSE